MYQRAHQKQRQVEVSRPNAIEPAVSIVGKRTLTEEQTFGAPDLYTRAIQAARRELRAVRTVLPTFIKTLRRKDLEPLTKQTQLTHAALQIRHLLLTANQHVKALEKAASYRDANVVFLRHDVDKLAARAGKLGIYRGAEDMRPRGHFEDAKQVAARGEAALRVRKPSPAKQRMQAIAKTSAPPTRMARGTARVNAVQRKATGAAYARDVHAAAARGVDGASAPLPFASQIQRAFGRHDVSRVRVQIGGAAAKAAEQIGAKAYATGETIAFATAPDLHTAAHEAAHVIQQRRGVSVAAGVGSTGDAYEINADAVADAVVAGRSAEALLETVSTGGLGVAVQRKPDAADERIDPDTKYTYRRKSEFDWRIGVVPAKVQLRWDVSLKDKGKARHGLPAAKGDATYAANQLLLESSAKGLDAKVSTSLMKANFDLLAEGMLPGELAALPLTPKVEIKGLEGGLSIRDGLDLKLMTLALYVEGDFSGLFDESTRATLEVKGQLRVECALEPELAKKLVELARATDAVTRSAKVEAKIAKTEKSLSYWRNRRAKDKVKQLEQELTKLRKVRAGVNKARDLGLKAIEQIGASLEKSAGGRLLKRAGGKAIAMAFKKFIPIYNLVSTAQDIYEAGKFLSGLDWGNVGERIIDGGPGGGEFSDASHEGTEAGGGGGFGEGGPGDDVSADSIEQELQREANVELHPTAKALVAAIETPTGSAADTQQLSKEDKETINLVVPADLSSYEIEAIKSRLAELTGATRQDLVTTVIEAVQQMRPFGQAMGPAKDPPLGPANEAPKNEDRKPKPAPVPARIRKRNVSQAKGREPQRIDLRPTLRRVIAVDPHGDVRVPSLVQFPGFRASVTRSGVMRVSFDNGAHDSEGHDYVVKVVVTPEKVPMGLLLPDGRPILSGEPIMILVEVGK